MQGQVQQVVEEVFPTYDRDHSGYLDIKELSGFLTSALKKLGINATVTDQQAETALRVIDRNSDKQVTKSEACEALKSILEYKQQKGGGQQQQPSVNPSGNNSWAPQPSQNNGWGQQPTQPQQNNWGQPPPQPNYGNSWGPGQNYNGWEQPQQPNNWNPPPSNNSWGPQTNNWGQQPPNYGGSWNPQPNTWNQPQPSWNQSQGDDWGGTSFNGPEDMEIKRLVDQLYMRYDRDRSGGLDRREMTRAMNELLVEYGVGMRINERQAGMLMRSIDDSGDGKVQKAEFFRMVKMIMGGQVY